MSIYCNSADTYSMAVFPKLFFPRTYAVDV